MSVHSKVRRTRKLRQRVVGRYGRFCWLCGEKIHRGFPTNHPDEFSIDHFIPRAAGGTDDLDNLRPSHRRCNNERERNTRPLNLNREAWFARLREESS